MEMDESRKMKQIRRAERRENDKEKKVTSEEKEQEQV